MARPSTTCSSRRSPSIREAADPGHRPAPLRRAVDGRRGAALRLGRRDEDRRGQDPGQHAARRTSTGSAARACTSSPSTTTWPASTPSGWVASTSGWASRSASIIPGFKEQPSEKRANYACDITYGTNNEFGFDYLRDNMATTLADKVQRGHNFAIVDEVDSILIDEARTPLIISGRVADAAKLYYRFASIVRSLKRDVDYEVEEDKRVVVPLEAGIEKRRAGPRHREPLRRGAAEPGAPAVGGPEGQGAVQARQGLHHPGRRGEDRRRVHRPRPRRAAAGARASTRPSRPRRV